MSSKVIDLNKTVYELTNDYPELIEILSGLGFPGVKNPVVRKTLGRTMTLIDGCRKQQKDINEVVKVLKENAFTVIGL